MKDETNSKFFEGAFSELNKLVGIEEGVRNRCVRGKERGVIEPTMFLGRWDVCVMFEAEF